MQPLEQAHAHEDRNVRADAEREGRAQARRRQADGPDGPDGPQGPDGSGEATDAERDPARRQPVPRAQGTDGGTRRAHDAVGGAPARQDAVSPRATLIVGDRSAGDIVGDRSAGNIVGDCAQAAPVVGDRSAGDIVGDRSAGDIVGDCARAAPIVGNAEAV
jgi:hypothetical protein